MRNIHLWLAEKQKQQSLAAIFRDAWLSVYQKACCSNQIELDVRNYEHKSIVPDYLLSCFERDRCTSP